MGHPTDMCNTLDQELLLSMVVELDTYRSGRSHFPALVSALDVGIGNLAKRDSAFVGALRKEWRILEEVNALALEQGVLYPLKVDSADADAAIRNIAAAIRDNLPTLPQQRGS